MADRYVDLGRALVTDANAEQMIVRNVAMNAVVMENVVMHGASVTHVDFNGSTIRFASLADTSIAECDLSGMTINGYLVTDLLRLAEEQSLERA